MKTTTSSSPSFRSWSGVPGSTATTLSRRQLDPLGRLAEVHRQRAGEDDEDLLLHLVGVAAAARAGRVAPEPRARLLQPGGVVTSDACRDGSSSRPCGFGRSSHSCSPARTTW